MQKVKIIFIFVLSFILLFGCEKPLTAGDYKVYEVDGQIIKGKDKMDEFYEKTLNGEKLELKYYRKYKQNTIDGKEIKNTFYIKFDGEYFITNYQKYKDSPQESKYQYLIFSSNEGTNNVIKEEFYCLSNDKETSYQKIVSSWLSSTLLENSTDGIAFYHYQLLKNDLMIGEYLSNNIVLTIKNVLGYKLETNHSFRSGIYEIIDGYLYLYENEKKDLNNVIVFKIKNNTLLLDSNKTNALIIDFTSTTLLQYKIESFDE